LDADAVTVLAKLSTWFADYNRVHPHSALQYRSPEMFREDQKILQPCPVS
jgi:transposase InsO family protein